jgi:hypothetical protein
MSDTASAPARAAPAKSIVTRMTSFLAGHAHMTLAIIIVLIVLVIGLFVYYHGLLFLGPYASAKAGFKSKERKKDADEDAAKADPETEKLIATINGR